VSEKVDEVVARSIGGSARCQRHRVAARDQGVALLLDHQRRLFVAGRRIHRMQDGKIAETWEVWDTLSFLQQIGVVAA
jgi:hypothetical protein